MTDKRKPKVKNFTGNWSNNLQRKVEVFQNHLSFLFPFYDETSRMEKKIWQRWQKSLPRQTNSWWLFLQKKLFITLSFCNFLKGQHHAWQMLLSFFSTVVSPSLQSMFDPWLIFQNWPQNLISKICASLQIGNSVYKFDPNIEKLHLK